MQSTYVKKLKRSHTLHTSHGFTIVELLIVIVVIAILAVISIATYSGVQDRARLSTAQSDMANIKKKLMLYRAENGQFPQDVTALTAAELEVTGSVYGPTPGYDNMIYCVNKDTDEFAFLSSLANQQSTLQISSTGGIQISSLLSSYANTCAPVGATEENRWVTGGLHNNGTWSDWLAH